MIPGQGQGSHSWLTRSTGQRAAGSVALDTIFQADGEGRGRKEGQDRLGHPGLGEAEVDQGPVDPA